MRQLPFGDDTALHPPINETLVRNNPFEYITGGCLERNQIGIRACGNPSK